MKTEAIWVWLLLCARCNVLAKKEKTEEKIYCESHNICELSCPAAYMSSNVVWNKNDNVVIFDSRSGGSKIPDKYTVTENGGKLKINKTTEGDKGKYVCEATYKGVVRSHYVIIELLDITIQNADKKGQINATVGEEITLVCNASAEDGTSNMTLKWISTEDLLGRETRTANIVTYMHKLTAIKTHHLQNYTCKLSISGSTRTFERSVQLKIRYPPDVSIVDYHNGTLKCNASGFPDKYSYNVWEHQSLFGEPIRSLNGSTDGYINVMSNGSYPSYQNTGIYKCSATNGVHQQYQKGEQRVVFEGKPVCISKSHQIMYGNVGKRVTLSVTLLSIPDFTEVYWLKSAGLKVVNSTKYYQIHSHFNISSRIYESNITIGGYNSSLAIDNFQKGDDCDYTVVVINPRGETKCIVQLVLNEAKPFTIPLVVGSVAAVGILLVVICFVFWKCKKAHQLDNTCDEDRYEKTENKRKPKPEDIYEEMVENLTSDVRRFDFASKDNLV